MLRHLLQDRRSRPGTKFLQRGNARKRHLQLVHLPGRKAPHTDFRSQPLQIANALQEFLNAEAFLFAGDKMFHHIQAAIDFHCVLQRHGYPTAQRSASHGGHRPVYDVH